MGEARVEYAASGRSGCRVCKQKIDQDDLRIARMVQSQKLYVSTSLPFKMMRVLTKPYAALCSAMAKSQSGITTIASLRSTGSQISGNLP